MDDETRAAAALTALQTLNTERMEYKAEIASSVLGVDDRTVTTLFSVDCLDSVGDIVLPGAFKKTITERKHRIPHLFMHDTKGAAIARVLSFQPVPRGDLPGDILRDHPETTGGWSMTSRYLKNPRAAEIYEGITEDIGYGASIGYRVLDWVKERQPDGQMARVIKELQLYEVSTTLPGTAALDVTRVMRLGKAYELLAEYKTGRRHSASDVDILNQIAELVASLGATNIQLLGAGPQPFDAALTSEVDALLSEVATILEVST